MSERPGKAAEVRRKSANVPERPGRSANWPFRVFVLNVVAIKCHFWGGIATVSSESTEKPWSTGS